MKKVRLLTPPCEHGRMKAEIRNDDGESQVTEIRLAEDAEPLRPGETMLVMERDEEPNTYRVTGEYTHTGPARSATPKYREGWDTIFGKRQVSGGLN